MKKTLLSIMNEYWVDSLPAKPNRFGCLNLSSNTLQHPNLLALHKEFYAKDFYSSCYAYPDYDSLKHDFATFYAVDASRIGFSSGSDSLISALMQSASCLNLEKIFLQTPFFYNYINYAKCYVKNVELFSFNDIFSTKTLTKITESKPTFIFLTSPCPLTGEIIPEQELSTWISSVTAQGHFVVLDQVYSGFGQEPYFNLLNKHEQLLIFHSFSKTFGGASVRMGFFIGHSKLVMRLRSIGIENTINNIAVEYAKFTIEKMHVFQQIRQDIMRWRDLTCQSFKKIFPQFKYFNSQANFISLDTNSTLVAANIVKSLLDKKIFIKKQPEPYASFLRITVAEPKIFENVFSVLLDKNRELA